MEVGLPSFQAALQAELLHKLQHWYQRASQRVLRNYNQQSTVWYKTHAAFVVTCVEIAKQALLGAVLLQKIQHKLLSRLHRQLHGFVGHASIIQPPVRGGVLNASWCTHSKLTTAHGKGEPQKGTHLSITLQQHTRHTRQ
jgi:hypothetical protein